MISELTIDGFKSLHNFKLVFNRGLNVLIGPNGAGKSNICQALGLIASAAEGPVARYILSLGGAPSVFSMVCSIEKENQGRNTIDASCKGETRAEEGNVTLKYKYSFSVSFHEDLRIVNETFSLYRKSKYNRYREILTAERQDETKVAIHIRDKREIGPISIAALKKRKRVTFSLERGPLTSFLPLLSYIFFTAIRCGRT